MKLAQNAKGGFEILVKSVENLNPLSTQIPFEVTGKVPADIDVRLNSRYIDLRNPRPRRYSRYSPLSTRPSGEPHQERVHMIRPPR